MRKYLVAQCRFPKHHRSLYNESLLGFKQSLLSFPNFTLRTNDEIKLYFNWRNITKFDILTAVLVQIPVTCYVTLCRLVIVIDVLKGSNIFIFRYKQPEKMVLDCLILETNTTWSLDIPVCFYKLLQLTTQSRSTERIFFKLGVSNIINNL